MGEDFCCTSDGTAPVETPVASPVETPVASPVETPVSSPIDSTDSDPVPVATPVTIPVASPSASSDFTEMLDAVNEERSHEGLGALCYNEKMIEAAQIHSNDMASGGFLSHTGSDGSSPFQRISNAGFTWTSAAENVAM